VEEEAGKLVNEDDIRFSDGLNTPLKAGDSLTVLPAVAGG